MTDGAARSRYTVTTGKKTVRTEKANRLYKAGYTVGRADRQRGISAWRSTDNPFWLRGYRDGVLKEND